VQEIIGQSVVIDNRTGGNALIAANALLQSPADGYSFLVDAANQITNPLLMRELPFDYRTAFAPVTQLASFPQVIAVKQDFPARTLAEFIALAKARPNTISYGTPPAAGMGHLAGELFQRLAGIRLVHAPYRGGADAARDLAAGRIDSVFISESSLRPVLESGKALPIGVTGAARRATLPGVPAIGEVLPGYDLTTWILVFAPAATPAAVQERLAEAFRHATTDPATRAKLEATGSDAASATPAEARALFQRDKTVITRLMREARLLPG